LLASSEQVSPNFWTDPANGTPYYLAVQTPEYRTDTFNDLKNTPVTKFARTPLSIARLSASAPSSHDLSLAAFTTNIAESNFRHTQVPESLEAPILWAFTCSPESGSYPRVGPPSA
jgi:hypothetical protein